MSNNQNINAQLTSDQRAQFWGIFTTALVGLFSFWLGIAIQDDISTKNARETQKLARYQLVDAVYPKYTQFIDTGGYVFYDILQMSSYEEERIKKELSDYMESEMIPFVETMKNSVNFMSDNRYYFSNNAQQRICQNNTAILFGLRLLEPNSELLSNISNDVVSSELSNPYYIKDLISYREQTEESLKARVEDFRQHAKYDRDAIAYYFLFLPYIDNFNIFSQELVPNDDIGSHLWKHIFILIGCIVIGLLISWMILKYVFKVKLTIKKLKDEKNIIL